MEILELQKKLQMILPPYRFLHTIGVAYTATSLAMCHGADISKVRLAGLLHDCAKYMKGSEMYDLAKKFEIEVNEFEEKAPDLLHAKLGAYFASHEYGVKDDEILSAIKCHTTGKPKMSLLEEIIFVADYIEPGRKGLPYLDEMRKFAFTDLHRATYLELTSTLQKIKSRNEVLDLVTLETYDYYKKLMEEKE